MAVANKPVERLGQRTLVYEVVRILHDLEIAPTNAADCSDATGISRDKCQEILADLLAIGAVTVSNAGVYTRVTPS